MAIINIENDYGYSATNGNSNRLFVQQALQAAKANNDGSTVVFSGKQWIIDYISVYTVFNTNIVFEEGCSIVASGNNLAANDPFIRAWGWQNVNITGNGVTMYRENLGNQFGHIWSFASYFGGTGELCSDITVRGINFTESNGDGILVRGAGRVYIYDCTFDNNSRQGISVVNHHDDVQVYRCKFSNTSGDPPSAGIDVEPELGVITDNDITQGGQLLFVDCEFNDNDGNGFVYASYLTSSAMLDIDMVVRNCLLYNNQRQPGVNPDFERAEVQVKKSNDPDNNANPVGGTILFEKIGIDGADYSAFVCRNEASAGARQVTLRDYVGYDICKLGDRQGYRFQGGETPQSVRLGNTDFDGVYAYMGGDAYVLSLADAASGGTFKNITGSIVAVSPYGKGRQDAHTATLDNAGATVDLNTSLPATTVDIEATTPQAAKGGQKGIITATRTSARIDYPLMVRVSIDTTNVNWGVDVGRTIPMCIIPAGETTGTIEVEAFDNGISETDRDIDFTLLGRTGHYTVGSNSTATITVVDEFTGGASADYAEVDGIVTMYAENLSFNSNWQVATSISGYTNSGYLRYIGPDSFPTPGNDTITTTIEISNTGVYQFQWYNIIGQGSSISDFNDSWVRFNDATEFFGGDPDHLTDIIYPNGSGQTPTANGAGSGNWFKAYANKLTWNWDTFTSDNDAHNIYVQFDTPGVYTMEISGRSFDHCIDRIVLHHVTVATDPLNLSNTETLGTATGPVDITGELKQWHTLTFEYTSAATYSETGSPNPFLDRRFYIDFTGPSAQTYRVPGYFAADGNAAESSASSGNKWHCKFVPDEAGVWNYSVSFRSGTDIAVEYPLVESTGTALDFDGDTGSLSIAATDKTGVDFRGKGRLSYSGGRYPTFANGDIFIKAGPDSPETALCFDGFDNTVAGPDLPNDAVKTYSAHSSDIDSGQSSWKNGTGNNILGMLNYLRDQGMNSWSFLTMNVIGDGENVWPWAATSRTDVDGSTSPDTENRTQYDVSKLAQWSIVFEYANRNGIFCHFKLQETENTYLLDQTALGTQRKLYYREMVARFGNLLALNWNFSEEYDLNKSGKENDTTMSIMKGYMDYMDSIDPYGHLRVFHTYPTSVDMDNAYNPMLGYPTMDGVSLQSRISDTGSWRPIKENVTKWVTDSAAAGRQWVVANDEQGPATTGVAADSGYGDSGTQPDNREDVRKNVLWATLMSGGWGVEYYYGYQTGQTDLDAEDHRSRATKWQDAKRAIDFFTGKGLGSFTPDDSIVTGTNNWALKNPGNSYILYLRDGGTASVTTTGSENYNVRWYDPRNGGALQTGSTSVIAPGTSSIGNAPSSTSSDWVVYLTPVETPPPSGNDLQIRPKAISRGGSKLQMYVGGIKIKLIIKPE